MGLQLKYNDVALTGGEFFYPEDGAKAPGSLLLYDFSNPLCIPAEQETAANPVNLAADTLRAVIGDPSYTHTISQGERQSMSPGRGAYLPAGTYPAGTRLAPTTPQGDFADYIAGGGTPATQPDLVFIGWYRPADTGFTGNPGRWGTTNNVSGLFYANRVSSDTAMTFRGTSPQISKSLVETGPLGLVQFAVSRTELFLNGAKAADFDATRIQSYDDWCNLMPTGSIYFFMNEIGTTITAASARWYRFLLEDYVASGRTALEAVRADYAYVTNYAPFRDTV